MFSFVDAANWTRIFAVWMKCGLWFWIGATVQNPPDMFGGEGDAFVEGGIVTAVRDAGQLAFKAAVDGEERRIVTDGQVVPRPPRRNAKAHSGQRAPMVHFIRRHFAAIVMDAQPLGLNEVTRQCGADFVGGLRS